MSWSGSARVDSKTSSRQPFAIIEREPIYSPSQPSRGYNPMTTPTPTTVQTFLNDLHLLNSDQATLVEALRATVKETVPSAAEAMKYGGILYSSGVVFCGVFAYRNHVSVEFAKGAQIADARGHLEGGGKHRRHVKLRSLEDIETKGLVHYLVQALAAARA